MKVLSNCSLTKLREYSQSYGAPETITVPYIKEFEREIWLLNECGEHTRTLKKGTKLLINYSGKEITQRQLNIRANKAITQRTNERLAYIATEKIKLEQRQAIAAQQGVKWAEFLSNNPQSKEKYIDKCNTLPSSKWRNYLRMKAAKHINEECFTTLQISAPELKAILFN